MRQPPPLGSRTWKPEEEDYLMEKWGQISVPAIAKKLNRTTNAVKVKAQRLGLGAVLMAGEYVTLNQLLLAVNGGSSSYGYKMKSWVENRGLPVHTKKVNRCSFRVVYIEEFWEWAERYRSFIDFSKMEPLTLGEEPDWVAEQRKKDFEAYAIQRKDPWGEDEDSRLKMLLSKHRYSWAEISEMMHRSHGAIARRCRDLGIKDRPVSMELTGKRGTWTSEDFEILADGIRHGDSYAAISLIERKPRRPRRRHTRDFCLFGAHNAASCAAFVQNSLSRPIGAQPATERRRCTISRRRTSAASVESTSNTGRISRRTSSPTAAFPAARRSIWPITRKLAPIRRCDDAHYHRSRQCSGRTGHWHKGADCSGFGAIRRYPCGVGRGSAANIPANADWRDCQPAGRQEEVITDWGELLRRFRN